MTLKYFWIVLVLVYFSSAYAISPLLLWQTFKISQLGEICFGFLSSLKMNQEVSSSNLKSKLSFFLTYISPIAIIFHDTPHHDILVWSHCSLWCKFLLDKLQETTKKKTNVSKWIVATILFGKKTLITFLKEL